MARRLHRERRGAQLLLEVVEAGPGIFLTQPTEVHAGGAHRTEDLAPVGEAVGGEQQDDGEKRRPECGGTDHDGARQTA